MAWEMAQAQASIFHSSAGYRGQMAEAPEMRRTYNGTLSIPERFRATASVHQRPCWTLACAFSELHSTDIGALFFLYIN